MPPVVVGALAAALLTGCGGGTPEITGVAVAVYLAVTDQGFDSPPVEQARAAPVWPR